MQVRVMSAPMGCVPIVCCGAQAAASRCGLATALARAFVCDRDVSCLGLFVLAWAGMFLVAIVAFHKAGNDGVDRITFGMDCALSAARFARFVVASVCVF